MRNHSAPDATSRPFARRARVLSAASVVRRTVGTFGVALALVAGAPVCAHADDDATIAMARERFREGVQFFDQKQYDKARAAFLQAYALKRHPAVLLNLAQSELRSDHEVDAAKHFSQYLREHKDASEAERQAAETGLAAAKAQIAELTITVDEDGAAIAVDGATEGQAPLPGPIFLKPGAHTITARKEGREATSQLTVGAGQAMSTTLRLRKSAAAGSPPAKAKPPEHDEAPTEAELEPVRRRESASTDDIEAEADVSQGKRQPFFKWAARSPVAWVGGGLTLIGAAGGIGFAIASRQNYADADTIGQLIDREAARLGADTFRLCVDRNGQYFAHFERACKAYSDNEKDGDNFKTAAWVSAGIGVGAAGLTIAYYFLSDSSREETSSAPKPGIAHVMPWFEPGVQGMSIGGAF